MYLTLQISEKKITISKITKTIATSTKCRLIIITIVIKTSFIYVLCQFDSPLETI